MANISARGRAWGAVLPRRWINLLELRVGPDSDLEYEAEAILACDRQAYYRKYPVGGQNAVYGILSPEQWEHRHHKEVLIPAPDSAYGDGIYHRAYNPQFGKRPDRWDNANPYGKPEFDRRVGEMARVSGSPVGLTRDTALPKGAERRWGLSRSQRYRIRQKMRGVPGEQRIIMRRLLADHYGVPTWVIYRLTVDVEDTDQLSDVVQRSLKRQLVSLRSQLREVNRELDLKGEGA